MQPPSRANSKVEDALCIRALSSLRSGSIRPNLGVHRKRGFTRLLRAAHASRLSRRLLPPPLPARSAPVTRSAWVGGSSSAGSAPDRVPSPDAGSHPAFFARPFPAACTRLLRPTMRPSQTRRTPNQALQRTAPRVTVAASSPPPSPPATQLPRRAPQSLSLGSLGVARVILQ